MVDSQELKELLGIRAKTIIADGLGLVENKSKKVICPLHNDHDPSMSWFNNGLMWRCNTCKEHIDIYRYLQEFKHMSFGDALQEVAVMVGRGDEREIVPVVDFVRPSMKLDDLTPPFYEYMEKRKITKETLDFWKVRQRRWNNNDVYVFQYFDDKNQLIYVSYRGLGKGAIKGGCEKNTKSILWGMWHADYNLPLVITEGQIDAMAVWQAGYSNVVSVPNGASNLKWIDHCWDWLKKFSEFIVFADNDKPGLEMAENIQKRLNNVKIVVSDRKDANEVLFYDGPEKIIELIEGAIMQEPAGLIDVSNIRYKSAMEVKEQTIETGFYNYDSHVEDWKMQEITVIFGRNGEGKTTFISQIIGHCIEKDTKTFLYSGEMSENKIQNWLYRQMIGANKEYLRTIIAKYGDKVEPLPHVVDAIKRWHRGKLFLFDRNESNVLGDLDKFFGVMELAAKRYDVKLFVIDNLMSILEENADSLYSDQANFVQRCKNFAIERNVHVVLLAHPNKEKREIKGSVGNLEKTDISGSNNIPNKADNIISVERIWDECEQCDAVITSLKDRESGQRKALPMYFSNTTLRFYDDRTKESISYGWERMVKKNG